MIPNPSDYIGIFAEIANRPVKCVNRALDTARCEIAIRRVSTVEHGSDIRQRVGTELAVWFGCTSSDFRAY
jgi:hypothetical protein